MLSKLRLLMSKSGLIVNRFWQNFSPLFTNISLRLAGLWFKKRTQSYSLYFIRKIFFFTTKSYDKLCG